MLTALGWFVHSPNIEIAIIFLTALGTYISNDVTWVLRPRLAHRWEYNVVSADNAFSHKGDCHIRHEADVLHISGVRRFTCCPDDGKAACKEVHIAWNSEWAQICHDNVIRFEYVIALPDPHRGGQNMRAICRLEWSPDSASELIGKFYVLPPFDQATLNCNWGDISLRKIGPAEIIQPPHNTPSFVGAFSAKQSAAPPYHGFQP